jgi:hypothetical protein
MKTSIPSIITIWLTITFSFLAVEHASSQTDREDSVEVADGKTDTTPTYVTGLTSARARSLVGGVIALISVIIGWRVKSRSSFLTGSGRSWAIAALAFGLIAMILSVVHLAGNTGGFGTGGGKAGAIIALILGLTGAVINWIALRSKGK